MLYDALSSAGKAFIESYKEAHPDDEVIHLDLYKENIPQIDADVFSGWGKLQSGSGFERSNPDPDCNFPQPLKTSASICGMFSL